MMVILMISADTMARDQSFPNSHQIEEATRNHPLPSGSDVRTVMPKNQNDTRRVLEHADQSRGNTPLGIDVPDEQRGIDVGAIIKRYYQQNRDVFDPRSLTANRDTEQGLLYFASFSMPKASLDRVVDQAAVTGASIVMRGTIKPGDIKGTAQAIGKVLNKRKVAFLIDPVLFQKFDIKQVPTLVVLPGKKMPYCKDSGCAAPTPPFWAVSGDVTIDHALEAIAQRVPAARNSVAPYLAQLRKGGFYDRR